MSTNKILVIDDDNVILKIVNKIITDAGMEAICTNNGKDGIETASNDNIDAIVLDINMPEMSGEETLIKLQENAKTKDIPIMMLTGTCDINEVANTFSMGAKDYIVKPFDTDNFLVRLRKIIADCAA